MWLTTLLCFNPFLVGVTFSPMLCFLAGRGVLKSADHPACVASHFVASTSAYPCVKVHCYSSPVLNSNAHLWLQRSPVLNSNAHLCYAITLTCGLWLQRSPVLNSNAHLCYAITLTSAKL